MGLVPTCPRCGDVAVAQQERWGCVMHGQIWPLWSPETPDYETFVEHLGRANGLPTWLPWPLAEGGAVVDFGAVCDGSSARAAFATCTLPSSEDGLVEITVVTEEPGVGLGARCAGLGDAHPEPEVSAGASVARLRVTGRPIALWPVSAAPEAVELDRFAFVGEAEGRWLWLVLRPASAALLLVDDWSLENLATMGPTLLDLPFRGAPRGW